MKLPERIVRLIASDAGASDKLITRILGSIRIETADSTGKDMSYELGLRINSAEQLEPLVMQRGMDRLAGTLGEIAREYITCCPLVLGWVGRGDFDPKKIPAGITLAKIKHSSRTAGRLRSKLLRDRGNTDS